MERERHKIPREVFKANTYKHPSLLMSVVKELIITFKKPLLFVFLGFLALLIFTPIITYLLFIQDIQNKERIMNRNQSGLTLLDRNEKPFFTFYQPKKITYTALSTIPLSMQQAVIAAEDRDFYTNPGFSLRGIFRAVRENLEARGIRQGGSTISQELVKNALLNSDRNFLRKYQELVLAIELNRRYSKEDILELYLNSVYFGEGAFGIENASQAYFGKSASQLTLAESALLTGLLPAPSAYSPLSNDPERAEKRQALVLDAMVETKAITKSEAEQAKAQQLVYSPKLKEPINTLAPHFALMVRDALIEEYGEERVIRSGFKVKTTLNRAWQEYAERTVKNQVSYLQYNKVSNGAAVAMDPKTGEILALVGSAEWEDEENGKINMAVRPRQPGSSFKPIIYAAALEKELITPATILEDKPVTFPGGYKPKNYDGRFRGPVTVRQSLANSLNIPSLEVMQKVGVSSGISFAQKLGISSLDHNKDYGLPLVLGAAEVPLLEMTSAYAVFAGYGDYYEPEIFLEIKDKYGKTVYTATPQKDHVIKDDTAFLISSILSDNTARAETFGNALTVSRPAAVKTGTTEDYRDSLTIGYTPNLVVGVWVGNNDNTPMDQIAGSTGAAPIWRLLMNQFFISLPNEQFRRPLGVVEKMVCPFKGFSSPQATGSAYAEYFILGTGPDRCEEPTPTVSPTESPENTPTPTPAPTDQPTNTPIPTATQAPTATPITIQVSPTTIQTPIVLP